MLLLLSGVSGYMDITLTVFLGVMGFILSVMVARYLSSRWPMKDCPSCGGPLLGLIYLGMPGRFCPICAIGHGIAADLMLLASMVKINKGFNIFTYAQGGYWRALWVYLTKPNMEHKG